MTPHTWPAETKQRAEKAMADLEAFWASFRKSTPEGRRRLMPQLARLRFEVVSASDGEGYVHDHLASLQEVCQRLARLRQPVSFDEEAQFVFGLGDVSLIRSQLYTLGLVEDDICPEP